MNILNNEYELIEIRVTDPPPRHFELEHRPTSEPDVLKLLFDLVHILQLRITFLHV